MLDGLLIERAHAKINLGLKVLGRRSDGYHDILSLAQCVDLADILHIAPAAADDDDDEVEVLPSKQLKKVDDEDADK